MRTVLLDLPDDALAALCERVVRNGEAHWCAVTCHTLRRAVLEACQKLKLPLSSMASTAYLTLRRLEQAMTLPRFRELVHANMNATSAAAARPHSLDRKWVWSPAGECALAACAPPNVLDYAWTRWRLSTDPHNPGCFVSRAAAAGRVDLLKEMDRTAEEQGVDPSHNWRTLHFKFSAIGAFLTGSYLRGMRQTLEWVEDALMEPALRSGKTGAIEWYYERMEMGDVVKMGASPQPKEMLSLWRCALDRSGNGSMQAPLTRLARAAALGKNPYAMLNFLQTWMWPRLGSRAPMQCRRAHIAIAAATVLSLLDATNDEAAQGWRWLQSAWPLGIKMMLEVLSSESTTHVAPIMRGIFEVRNVKVYQWMSASLDDGKWMHGLCGVNTSHRSRRLRFAHATLGSIAKRRSEQDSVDPEAEWELDRALCVQALADAFAWAWERSELDLSKMPSDGKEWQQAFQHDTCVHADMLLEHDPWALVDALCKFASGADPKDPLCTYTRGYLRGSYVEGLREPGSWCTCAMADKLQAVGLW